MLKVRILFVLMLAAGLLAACQNVSITGSGNVLIEEESFSDFDKVDVSHGFEVDISADVPPGCGTGSSAAISVALLNALGVVSGEYLACHEIAHLAHRLEPAAVAADRAELLGHANHLLDRSEFFEGRRGDHPGRAQQIDLGEASRGTLDHVQLGRDARVAAGEVDDALHLFGVGFDVGFQDDDHAAALLG